MPFGLTNAPGSFQALMNDIFSGYLRMFVLVFFDDILIYSANIKEHEKHLKAVVYVLRNHQLFIRRKKCEIALSKVEYLGHVVTSEGVAADSKKIEAMLEWPRPTNIRALRGFIGLSGNYRRFIRGYGIMDKPLTQLLKKGGFHWNVATEEAF